MFFNCVTVLIEMQLVPCFWMEETQIQVRVALCGAHKVVLAKLKLLRWEINKERDTVACSDKLSKLAALHAFE